MRRFNLSKTVQTKVIVTLVIALVGGVGVIVFLLSQNTPIIPRPIAKQLNFAIYWPTQNTDVSASRSSIKYDSKDSIFSYVTNINSTPATITEQPTPDEFNNIPDYYSTLITHLNNYDTFSALPGTVYLTKPKGVSGETAVMNSGGTLLFVHASSNLPANQWRAFFNDLSIVAR